MDFKDTIMSPQQHSKFQREYAKGQIVESIESFMVRKQAEVSFKAGLKEAFEQIGKIQPPSKWNEVYKRAFKLSQQHIIESLKEFEVK